MQDVTLNQVVDVYQKLLQNDGVEADHPLSIMLSIRPKFTTRLVSLISQAAEGHGLSKVITWHDDSESADDTAEIAQNGSLQVHKSQDDTHNGISQVSPDEVNGQEATDVAYTPQKEISSEPQQAIEMTKPETASHETSGENQTLDSSTFVPIATEEGLQHEDKEGSATGNNEKEENDLLDYDDEDVHQVDNSDRPLVREAKADQDNTKTEYAVTNEDPHPESTFAEEHIPEQTNEHEDDAEHEDNQDAQHEEDESDGPEDDQTHHQAASGDYIHDELSYEHEGATHEEFTYGSSELAERTTAAGDTDTHATFEDKSNSDRQYDNVDEQEDPEEPEYNGVDGEEEQEYDETGEEEPTYTYSAIENRGEEDTTRDNSSIATSPAQNNPTSSNFTFTDLVESESATMSANTLEADEIDLGEAQDEIENGVDHNTPDANEYELKEQEDEIDYDDEDESEVVEHQKTPVPEITSEPNGSSGKRLRADAGLEDILDEDSQEAKRPRS
ncbi:hypothetical protein F5884DRAFT_192193 [Xylogone sp. PMI_703]|nr:hypothetical protein F5884DRAFT_192193 [Xylogone sp. PMI_703]